MGSLLSSALVPVGARILASAGIYNVDGGVVLHGIGSNLLLDDGVLVVISLGSCRQSISNDLGVSSSINVVIR